MREKELREHETCDNCGEKIGHTGIPLFWIVKIQRHGLKVDAIQRQQGLAMMLNGNAAIAQVMGADEEMTQLMSEKEITLCETCGTEKTDIAVLAMED